MFLIIGKKTFKRLRIRERVRKRDKERRERGKRDGRRERDEYKFKSIHAPLREVKPAN